jgi:ribosomal protein S18 acetylase RimI-like enzyme
MSTDRSAGAPQEPGVPPLGEELELTRPGEAEWRQFLDAAVAEGWRVPASELALLEGPLADGALCLRRQGGFAGLVSFVHHGASAWIGNLIVPAALRGRGYGRLLLEGAMRRLEEQGARSVWLTASEDGYPLYRRRGFQTLGQVERWVRAEGGASDHDIPRNEADASLLEALELAAWGERRALLTHLVPQARLVRCGANVALLQREPGMQILGPWYAGSGDEKERLGLLDAAVAVAAAGEELVLDLHAGAVAEEVLTEAGFLLRGRTRLMARGDVGDIDLRSLVSFASLGSMG